MLNIYFCGVLFFCFWLVLLILLCLQTPELIKFGILLYGVFTIRYLAPTLNGARATRQIFCPSKKKPKLILQVQLLGKRNLEIYFP